MRTFPRWVTWIFLLFLGYVLLVGNFSAPARRAADPTSASRQAERSYPGLQQFTDATRWKRAISPDYAALEKACQPAAPAENQFADAAFILRDGTGDEASCGDTVHVTVETIRPDGTLAKPREANFTLGKSSALDPLLIGMRADEVRVVLFTPRKLITALPGLARHKLAVLRITGGVAAKPAATDLSAPLPDAPAETPAAPPAAE